MNIFYLDEQASIAASYHCDKHVVKMILETAQLLCTAHRVLDGKQTIIVTEAGRNKKVWKLDDEYRDKLFYGATHINHPCAVWVRESPLNYMWAYNLMISLNSEFVKRYGHTDDHLTIRKLSGDLKIPPKALYEIKNAVFTTPPQCVAEDCLVEGDVVAAYKKYYIKHKSDIAKWRNGKVPDWYTTQT